MRVVVVTPVRLFGESLAACFSGEGEIEIAGVVADLESLSRHIAETPPDLVLIDISQGFDLEEIGALAATHSGITLVALGLREQREEVIRHARAGFQAYVARDAALATLEQALIDARAGRLRCPAEIAAGLMDALRRMAPPSRDAARLDSLTRREEDVLRLIGRGLSNKEIANELALSVATVKHHVHAILGKLALTGRTQAMRRVRATPWLNG